MHHADHGRTMTAMFDSRAEADRAVEALRALGVTDVHVQGQAEGAANHDERGFFESLGDFFFPDDDRAAYAHGMQHGAYLVVARDVPAGHEAHVQEILDREGSVDLDARETEWRDGGWDAASMTGRTAMATDGTHDHAGHGHRDVRGTETVDVVEEQLNIGKRVVDTGTVRVRSYVREVPVSEDVHLTETRVDVQRRAVDRPADAHAFEDRVIEARGTAEQVVVEKTARVVEEIEIAKTQDSRVERVEDTLKKTEVEIDGDASVTDPNRPRH